MIRERASPDGGVRFFLLIRKLPEVVNGIIIAHQTIKTNDMRNTVLVILMFLGLNVFAQSEDLYCGVKPMASAETKKKCNMYKLQREVTKVTEGRLAFKNSAQGDFIQEKSSYKYVVFDRSNPESWKIELYANDGLDPRDPYVSVYRLVANSLSFLENTLEAAIVRESPNGPQWTSLRIVESDGGYVFLLGDAYDRWNGKIVMKWVCKKGTFEDPKRVVMVNDEPTYVEVIEIDE